jgi:hypothetical protein
MAFIPFLEHRPDVDDFRGQHTQVLAGVLPRGDGYGPMPSLQGYAAPLSAGNDSFTKILLHMDGTNGSTTFTDSNSGGSAHTWTAAGDAKLSTALFKFGGACGIFDGTGDFITTPDSSDFTLGSGDFTVDCWFNCTAAAGAQVFLCGQNDGVSTASSISIQIQRFTSNVIIASAAVGAGNTSVTGTTQFTNAVNTGFHHLAFVRSGNTLKLFIDGVQEGGNVSISGTINDSSTVFGVGTTGALTASNTWNGNIDEFRLSVGIARWTAAFTPPQKNYDTAANGVCRGAFYGRKSSDGSIAVFAGTSTRLFKLNNSTLDWQDISNGLLAYSAVPTTDQWQFAQFGDTVVAVQANSAPQAFDLAAGVFFAALGGSPPTARYVAVVGRFLVLAGLTSNPRRVQWSDLDGITTWGSTVGFSNFVDLPDGGIVRGVAGGEFGLAFQESTTRRMTYRGDGSKPAFAFERVSEEKGLLGPYSIIRGGERVFFVSPTGFQMYAGGAITPIGKERVDRTFLADLDTGNLQMLIGAADPSGTRVFWAYKSLAGSSTTAFDKLICYDYGLDRWSPIISLAGEYLVPIVKPGVTLDSLDTLFGTNIDTLSISSLDAIAAALVSKLAAVNASHQLGFFDGANLEAVLETPEQSLEGQRIRVRGFEPRSDATTIFGSIRYRSRVQDTLVQTTEAAVNTQGRCTMNRDTKLARGRIRIPAGTSWTYAMGIEPDFIPTGKR